MLFLLGSEEPLEAPCMSKLITRSLEYTFAPSQKIVVILSLVMQQISPFHLTHSTHLSQLHMHPHPHQAHIHPAHHWSPPAL